MPKASSPPKKPQIVVPPKPQDIHVHEDDLATRVKKSVVQYWIDQVICKYFDYYSGKTVAKRVSLDYSVDQLK